MRKIIVLTTSRSDFGLQAGMIREFAQDPEILIEVVATGSHVLGNAPSSLEEVERFCGEHGVEVVVLPLTGVTEAAPFSEPFSRFQMLVVSKMMEEAHGYLVARRPDAAVFLGDRWELMGFVYSAFLLQIPLVHVSGGETTEGAIDDVIRHSLTKLSTIHIVAAEKYGEAISRMGEEDWRIALCGEPGLDWVHAFTPRARDEVYASLGISSDDPLVLLALHPATLESASELEEHLAQLGAAVAGLREAVVVMTAPNSEIGSEIISAWAKKQKGRYPYFYYFESLGHELFLSTMAHAFVVVGNSSSGIVEAPSVGVPSINLGARQSGRLRADSVSDVGFRAADILAAINLARSRPQTQVASNPYDPFFDGGNSRRAVSAVISLLKNRSVEELVSKKLDFNVRQEDWITQ